MSVFRALSKPKFVKIVEVGPRDGLQNEKRFIPTSQKIQLINKLANTGLQYIEATSFVSPKRVPQMADAKDVMAGISRFPGVNYTALAPNEKGMLDAISCGIKEIEIFTSASEPFCQKKFGM